VDVLAHRLRRDHVLGALEDEGRGLHVVEVGPVVGEEGRAGEALGDLGVGAAEAVR
jgi:hypothetical protein